MSAYLSGQVGKKSTCPEIKCTGHVLVDECFKIFTEYFPSSTLVLEGEMYQLSHMLTDQKSVLSAMMELSITGNKSL